MSGDSRRRDLSLDTEQAAVSAGELVRDWLEELERTGSGVLQACPLRVLEQAFFRYLEEASPQPALDQLLSECPREELERAARLLRTRAAMLSPETAEEARIQLEVLSFASSVRTLSFARRNEPTGAQPPSVQEMRPTEVLWHTAAGLRAAKTMTAMGRALAEGAAALCEARGAIWWKREGQLLRAGASIGIGPGEEEVNFRPTRHFWGEGAKHRGSLQTLSAEVPEQAAFLERVHAERAVMVRLWEAHRWVGALSVQDGVFDEERLDLLAAIAQQAAATLRTIDLEHAKERAESTRQGGETGFTSALTSAANLDELLTRSVCWRTISRRRKRAVCS